MIEHKKIIEHIFSLIKKEVESQKYNLSHRDFIFTIQLENPCNPTRIIANKLFNFNCNHGLLYSVGNEDNNAYGHKDKSYNIYVKYGYLDKDKYAYQHLKNNLGFSTSGYDNMEYNSHPDYMILSLDDIYKERLSRRKDIANYFLSSLSS